MEQICSCKGRVVQHLSIHAEEPTFIVQKHNIKISPSGFGPCCPYVGWVNKETIEKAFQHTTQWADASTRYTMDANLNHCLATGKSLIRCLHFVNKTPVDWYSKKQATMVQRLLLQNSNRADHGH